MVSSSTEMIGSRPDIEQAEIAPKSQEDPYSVFSNSEKRWIVFLIAMAGFFSPLSANIYFPAINYLARDLSVSLELINLTITAYLVCQGVVPSLIGDTADMVGRRPVYIAAFVVYLAANIGLALQHSYAALLLLRILQSSGSSAILSGLCLALIIVCLPETARKLVGNASIPPQRFNRTAVSYMSKQMPREIPPDHVNPVFRCPNPLSCLRIVLHKDTALVLVANAFFYMNYSCMQASLAPLLMDIYRLNALQVGLTYLPYGIACGVASFLVGLYK
ncbi:MAG: hypothetical protein Q9180_005000 [Flavoplaca navasiana]